MNLNSIFDGVVSNAIWAVIALILITLSAIYHRHLTNFFKYLQLGKKIYNSGVNRFLFSRHEYPERLDAYLNRAQRSIKIISISFKLTSDECQLAELFRRKLAAKPTFDICISLLRPASEASRITAASLGMRPKVLDKEISDMLNELKTLRNGLSISDRDRLKILTHDSMPMGSAIMLDADHPQGVIQVETKLYKSARSESFSFEIRAGTSFFEHHLECWNRIIAESQPAQLK